MAEEWVEQMQNQVNSVEKLEKYINLTDDERGAIETLDARWGMSPYFASLMDKDDPNCPIRKQMIPSMKEQVNEYGMKDYLVWKENRDTEEVRPKEVLGEDLFNNYLGLKFNDWEEYRTTVTDYEHNKYLTI